MDGLFLCEKLQLLLTTLDQCLLLNKYVEYTPLHELNDKID